ncbi:hypothetical protein C5167_033066 [Papaver somniferum]|uniref:Uncharacterized protein n=1 Tax=Papaver somniferum TaxID=3469 RepID=A0A4Y7K996_PAPSO|nr:hypothetical protein C5167_033066 [Papaver somniferum]
MGPEASAEGWWKSPNPYLFGGLAIMLCLIAVALIILVCSYRKTSSNDRFYNDGNDLEKARKLDFSPREMEPKFVVIMAGNENPTFLAEPTLSSSAHQNLQQL